MSLLRKFCTLIGASERDGPVAFHLSEVVWIFDDFVWIQFREQMDELPRVCVSRGWQLDPFSTHAHTHQGFRVRVQGFRVRVQGFRVQGSGF